MADRPSHRKPAAELTPDELEQRQRADGTWEEPSSFDDAGAPPSPDVLEQRQRLDGTVDRSAYGDSDEPLTPDMIEQRQEIEDDDADAHPTD